MNRGLLSSRDEVDMQVEVDRIRINLSLTSRRGAQRLDVKSFQHHLEVYGGEKLLHCFTLPQAVEPDSLTVSRQGVSVTLEMRIKQGSGHPKPVRPAADERSEGCVEHPRSRTSALEREKGHSA